MAGSEVPEAPDPLRQLWQDVDRLFEAIDRRVRWGGLAPYPPINLFDAGNRYILTTEVPGQEPEAIELTVAGDGLTIAGERRAAEGVDEDLYRRRERPVGRWSRTVALPGRVEPDRASASFAGGVLTVELYKVDDAKPRQIAVRAATV